MVLGLTLPFSLFDRILVRYFATQTFKSVDGIL